MSDDRLARIEAKLDSLVTDVAVLKTDVAVLKTDVAGLKTDVAVLKTDVAALDRRFTKRFDDLEAHLADTHAYIAFADTKLQEEFQAGFRESNARFDKIDVRFDRLDQKIDRFIKTQGGINLDVELRLRGVEGAAATPGN